MNFIIRWLVTAVAVGVAVWIVPGIELLGGTDAWVGIAIFGLILSLINISIKPIMQLLSLPIGVACERDFPGGAHHRLIRQRVCGLHRYQHRLGAGQRPGGQQRLARVHRARPLRHRRIPAVPLA